MKAVQFDEFGGVDVLDVRDVPDPTPQAGEVLVRVRAAAINPGEIAIREGVFAERWPSTFPEGQGSDFAGVVEGVGDGVGDRFAPGTEVAGWSDSRSSHAELVAVPATQVISKPASISWEVAGSLFIAPLTGLAAVEAAALNAGEVVVVSGAAGGVGSAATQLAVATGATVIGLASPDKHAWLREHGAVPVAHGAGQADGIRAAADGRPIAAFIDTYGHGYVDFAVGELGVSPARTVTIIDWDAAERTGAVVTGGGEIASAQRLAQLAELVVDGTLTVPIAETYPLSEVRAAFEALARRRTLGKIVLVP